jgi:cell division protein FtsB
MLIDFSKISEYINVIILPLVTALGGWWGNRAYAKFRKRTEEVEVTGTEHDTVKRISNSSIETIESLSQFAEQMTAKTLSQRIEFSIAIEQYETEIRENELEISKLKTEINKLKIELNKIKDGQC